MQLAVAQGVTVISAVAEHDEPLARELGATPVRYGAGLPGRVRALGAIDAVFGAAGKADGRLRLRAHTSMPMQQAAEAHRQLESGNTHERIILTLE